MAIETRFFRPIVGEKKSFPSQTAKGQEIEVLLGDRQGNYFSSKTFSPAGPKAAEKLTGEKRTEETLLSVN